MRWTGALAAVVLTASCTGGQPAQKERPEVQRGIALPSWQAGDYGGPRAGEYVAGIAATGARWIQLNPTWYQRDVRDHVIRPTGETAADDGLRRIIGIARRAGLKVLLKPHVDLPGDVDRAEIRPADRRRWFASYTRFITHYADLARETGVAGFAVGTELAGTSGDREGWLGVVREVRARFKGPLVYAANYDAYRRVAFWDAVDLIGVDAYWPLSDRPTSDVARLRAAWRPILAELAAFSRAKGRRVLFTEAGYVSQRGATTEPFSWEVSAVNGDAEQAAAYEALLAGCQGQDWWAGVHWWMWDDWPGSDQTPRSLAYTPRGKPAEQVLRRWWVRG